jgi:hypothetical protein
MHDVKEIEKDIFKVEGISVSIDDYSFTDKFISKYSEFYKNQLPSKSGEEDLEDRIITYLKTDQTIKDKLLEKVITDMTIEKRRDQIVRIMSNHVITSLLTTVMLVSLYFILK